MGSLKKFLNKYLWYLMFIPLPMILLIVSQWEMSIRGSYFERENSDPEYAYLLNGLLLVDGQTPFHVDHPGTTLQMLTAIAIDFRHAIKGFQGVSTSVTDDVLLDPEGYLFTIHNFMVIGISLLFFFIAIQTYNKTGFVWAAIGFQLFPFLSTSVILSLVRVSPEPFLIITVLLGTILLIEITEKKHTIYSAWHPILMGLFLGVGLVTKLTFLPFLLLALWFPRLRDRIIVITSFIVTFFLLTIPIWSRVNYFINWVKDLVIKQGSHGTGANSVLPPFQTMISNLITLVREEPFYFIILAVLILWCILIWRKRTPENQLERLRVSLSSGILVILLIFLIKFPQIRDMIPGLAWLGFIFLMGIFELKTKFSIGSKNYKIFRAAILILLLGLATINTFSFFNSTLASIGEAHLETQKIDTFLKSNYPDCNVITYYGASDQRFALLFGNTYAGNLFEKSLTNLYPNAIAYNVWTKTFRSPSEDLQYADIIHLLNNGECILLRGGASLYSKSSSLYNVKLKLVKIISYSHERVYQLKAILPKSP